jgi:protein-L-isoaspartate(D-aspartate) O-methyltransferase
MDDLTQARLQMVRHQIAGRGIRSPAVLEAMRNVPREFFVPPHLAEFAYLDTPLPIEAGQTISQPYIVALMIESAAPRPSDRALEIGTGSGYGAAILSRLVAKVYTIERHEELVELARNASPNSVIRILRFCMAMAPWGGLSMPLIT